MKKIAIIGLGYVGLPLAVEFAKKYTVLGFDINASRVEELKRGEDFTLEVETEELKSVINSEGLSFSSSISDLSDAQIYIVTVPTPIDAYNNPDLKPLLNASEMIGEVLKKGNIVIYESTVYPGCTEEDCVPVLEKISGLKYNTDFYCGYSPERINPGDKINTLTKIKKVVSGSTPEITESINQLYSSIIEAGTFKATSIKVAEASKAIENAQRDVNISFMNELALIFDRLGIDTNDVIDAAASKWNFLKYRPGLVGGHCIGVDPYYLVHKAKAVGYHPDVISSGRRVNNSIAEHIANKVLKLMIHNGDKIKGSKVLLMGLTFKENCPDIRNTKVVDIYKELAEFGLSIDLYDPWASAKEVKLEYDIDIIDKVNDKVAYNAIIVAVAHDQFKTFDFKKYKDNNATIYDAKNIVDRSIVDARL